MQRYILGLAYALSVTAMKFPITKEGLKTYREKEAIIAETNTRIIKAVSKICNEVEIIALRTTDTLYTYNYMYDPVILGELRPTVGNYNLPQQTSILPQVVSQLKEFFPDSSIGIDLTKKFIVIDWT